MGGLRMPWNIPTSKYPIEVIGNKRWFGETAWRKGSAMLFLSRHANWDNRDYREYRDHRTRVKRRLRLRMAIGLMLMAGILTAAAWFPGAI